MKILIAVVLYGVLSGLASLGIYALFGPVAQWVAIPFFFLGGLVVGGWAGSRA